MLFFYKAVAWVPAVEPGSCSHVEIRIKEGSSAQSPIQFKKRFVLQAETGYWAEWLVPVKVIKGTLKKHGTTDYIFGGARAEIAMVSINGKDGPLAETGLAGHVQKDDQPLILYNEPPNAKATKKKKPVVDAHWNVTAVSWIPQGLGKEIQSPG